MWRKKIPFALLILLAGALLTGKSVFAQTPTPGSFDLTTSPVFFDFNTKPGNSISDKLRVRNNTNADMTLKVDIKKLGGDPRIGELTIIDPEQNDPFVGWIKFKDNQFSARSREWVDVPFTINVPKDAAFGYYYAIILSQVNNGSVVKNGASLTGASALPVLLVVQSDGAKSKANLLEFKTNSFVNEFLPIDFTVRLENVGNVHVRPHGNIFVRSGKDHDLAILDVNQGQGALIPGVSRTYQASWDDGFIVREPVMEDGAIKYDKNRNPVTKIKINWDKLTHMRIGKYTANLLLVYDSGKRDEVIEGTTTFWVIPYTFIAIVLAGLVVAILILRFLLKAYVNRELRRREKR